AGVAGFAGGGAAAAGDEPAAGFLRFDAAGEPDGGDRAGAGGGGGGDAAEVDGGDPRGVPDDVSARGRAARFGAGGELAGDGCAGDVVGGAGVRVAAAGERGDQVLRGGRSDRGGDDFSRWGLGGVRPVRDAGGGQVAGILVHVEDGEPAGGGGADA